MKKSAVAMVFLMIAAGAFAQEAEDDRHIGEIEVGASADASIFAVYAAPDVSALYKPRRLGIGAGTKAYIGLTQRDFYIAPYIRAELGWFYLGAGPLVIIQQPEDGSFATIDSATSFFATSGVSIPIIPLSFGNIVLNLGTDIALTASKAVIVNDTGNFFADLIATIIASAYGVVFNAIKLNVGVGCVVDY